MAGANGRWWASQADAERLRRARRICYLVGGYTGRSNYGDILQLLTALDRAAGGGGEPYAAFGTPQSLGGRRAGGEGGPPAAADRSGSSPPRDEVLPVAVLEYGYRGSHLDLRQRCPAIGDACVLYCESSLAPRGWLDGAGPAGLTALPSPPAAPSRVLVYGGGNLVELFGRHLLETIGALDRWLASASERAAPDGPVPLLIVGQQVSAGFLAGEHSRPVAALFDRASAVGVRDELSARAIAHHSGLRFAHKVWLSGDDGVPRILAAWPDGGRAGGGPGEPAMPTHLSLAVHLSLEYYVTADPERLLEAVAAVVQSVRRLHAGAVTLNLLVAFEDRLLSEARHAATLRGRLADIRGEVRRVDLVDDLERGFPTLREADLVVSCSYHVALTSLLLGRPTVLVCASEYYRHKFRGLQREFQVPEQALFDVDRDSPPGSIQRGLEAYLRDVVLDPGRRAAAAGRAAAVRAELAERSDRTARLVREWLAAAESDLDGGAGAAPAGDQSAETGAGAQAEARALERRGRRGGRDPGRGAVPGDPRPLTVERSGAFEQGGGPGIWATLTAGESTSTVHYRASSGPLARSADAFLAAALLPAMRLGVPLRLGGVVSRRLLESGVPRIQSILRRWYPSLFTGVPVEAAGVWEGTANSGRGVGLFFSGGVDSFYVALKRLPEITALIFVQGFDVRLTDWPLRESVLRGVRAAAAELGKPLVEVETDLRECFDQYVDWQPYHGAALASVAQALAPQFSRVYVAPTYHYADLVPSGSHPLLDPLWSSEDLEIVHDAADTSKPERVAALARSETALRWLRVCWENRDGEYNCGRCQKCLGVMAALRAVGALDRCATFQRPLDLAAFESTRTSVWDQPLNREILAFLEGQGDDPELSRAVRGAIARHEEATAQRVDEGLRRELAERDAAAARSAAEATTLRAQLQASSAEVARLRSLVAGYERGRAIRVLNAIGQVRQRLLRSPG